MAVGENKENTDFPVCAILYKEKEQIKYKLSLPALPAMTISDSFNSQSPLWYRVVRVC